MKEMREENRPYEKCTRYGAAQLTDVELLAVLLRTGTKGMSALELAQNIIKSQSGEDSLLNIHTLTLQKLKAIKGIGNVKAIQILCLSELAKRLAQTSARNSVTFEAPSTIAEYYKEEMRHQKQEHMKLLMLDTKSKLIGEQNISKGTVNAALITPRELFIEALACGAVYIILLHNHPSGDPTPSKSDILLTKRVKEAGELIGIQLLDHIIIGNNCYISLTESQMI